MSRDQKGVATRIGRGLPGSRDMGEVARTKNRVLQVGIFLGDTEVDSRLRGDAGSFQIIA